ncbi:2-C-methyl-D-erythritol 4-phosphate cytidylyltransferase [uncultured Shewanella sp.]|uniref:2-C-methyl-D-erythritol 4-phosphate cytidylyltransferase n=1 Tax=uncultured Shewanella sp. TaxID=173975 RepID=UPI00262EBD24|nr:2-C-methyl-D-erythritol 4-phosphate cytidylyltransferase [uncultured Shewanella sp.]
MKSAKQSVVAIVPAAGIGARMGASIPKQYLMLGEQTILAHTLDSLISHPDISKVIVALHPEDDFFAKLTQANHEKVLAVIGGNERADSVLAALNRLDDETNDVTTDITSEHSTWALVHDAARPCLTQTDIDKLLESRAAYSQGAILAMPVRDTMKRSIVANAADKAVSKVEIAETVCRDNLWHALTPQLFPSQQLKQNLSAALEQGVNITDEASAMEWAGVNPGLVSGRADNIKVTHPDDLQLAKLFLANIESL